MAEMSFGAACIFLRGGKNIVGSFSNRVTELYLKKDNKHENITLFKQIYSLYIELVELMKCHLFIFLNGIQM